MGFSTKHPAWIAARLDRLGRKFRAGQTACPFCCREMWFTDFETIPMFLDRAGESAYAERKGRVATLDHIVPRAKGGPNAPCNYTPMCDECNSEKGARDPLEWIAERQADRMLAPGRARKFRKQERRTRVLMAKIKRQRRKRKRQQGRRK